MKTVLSSSIFRVPDKPFGTVKLQAAHIISLESGAVAQHELKIS